MNSSHTVVSIHGPAFHVDGVPTCHGRTWRGHRLEGLLFNLRAVQATFDDVNPATRDRWAYPDGRPYDPERQTREFVAALPTWRAHGLRAVTLNWQGGSPEGYSRAQPWHNSAWTAEGDLRSDHARRMERAIAALDRCGMVAILGLFYFGQDHRLRDEAAVLRAVDTAVDWIFDRDLRNVIVEIDNECDIRYAHPILKPPRVAELIARVAARTRDGRRLLVGTSFSGGTVPTDEVIAASDLALIHGNGVEDPRGIADLVAAARRLPSYRPMPIVVNEDDHFAFDAPVNNMQQAIASGASWGYFDPGRNDYVDGHQSPPTRWDCNTARKRAFFATLREVTGGD